MCAHSRSVDERITQMYEKKQNIKTSSESCRNILYSEKNIQHTQTAGKEVPLPPAKETRLNRDGTWFSKLI